MTLLSRLMAVYPAMVLASAVGWALWTVVERSAWGVLGVLASLYLLPLITFRLHERVFPIHEGPSHLVGGPYSPWWGSHQIQGLFIAFPALETALRLVPGLFSAWLRAWGSRVGDRVYWTPRVQIADRSLLDIGDDVIFGYDVSLSSHIIKRTRKNVLLYVRPIAIGAGAFLGVGVVIGPGVVVEAGAIIEGGSWLYPNSRHGSERRRGKPRGHGDGAPATRAHRGES